MKFYLISLGLLLFCADQVNAQLQVSQVLDHKTIEISQPLPIELKPEGRLVIYSLSGKKVVGYATLKEVTSQRPFKAKAEVLLREDNGLIVVGDEVRVVDLSERSLDYPGRIDLVIKNREKTSARFKPLVYQGATLGETAETVDQGEHMVDIAAFYFFGVTDKLTLATWVPAFFGERPNLKLKYKFVDNKWFVISQSFLSLYDYSGSDRGFYNQLVTYIDVPTNTKFTSHTQIRIAFDPQIRLKRKEGGSFGQSTIQSGYQYVFDNWDRLLYGPVYNFDTQAVGGYVSYMMIWDHFHAMVTLQTHNLTRFKLDYDEGYFASLYFFWRF